MIQFLVVAFFAARLFFCGQVTSSFVLFCYLFLNCCCISSNCTHIVFCFPLPNFYFKIAYPLNMIYTFTLQIFHKRWYTHFYTIPCYVPFYNFYSFPLHKSFIIFWFSFPQLTINVFFLYFKVWYLHTHFVCDKLAVCHRAPLFSLWWLYFWISLFYMLLLKLSSHP